MTIALVAVGCSRGSDKYLDARPATVDAEVEVTYKSKPVEGATVVFAPVDGKYSAAGITNSRGRAVLQTFPPEFGAVPGNYKVTVTLREVVSAPALPEGVHADDVKTPKPKSLIPEKYSDLGKSGLEASIPQEGKTDIKFELKD